MVERQSGRKVKVLRTDNGGEYTSQEFEGYLKMEGIIHQTTIPGTPQQNGVAERFNRVIMERARCMRLQANLAISHWSDAVVHAVYLINRTPKKTLHGNIPEAMWRGRKVKLDHLQIFGSPALLPSHLRSKLGAKSRKMIFIARYQKGFILLP